MSGRCSETEGESGEPCRLSDGHRGNCKFWDEPENVLHELSEYAKFAIADERAEKLRFTIAEEVLKVGIDKRLSECIGSITDQVSEGGMRVPKNAVAYPHYYRLVPRGITHLDVYRVLDMFGVERSAVAHAIKTLLCMGKRGSKNELRDLREARDSIDRQIEMLEEDAIDFSKSKKID